jgi:GntR family transcriptional regulator
VNGRIPRYHRIAEALREQIRDGEFVAGARLDNQRKLARDFGVTLMTLRHALDVLEREQLITRQHGRGTFVAAPSIDYDIRQLNRFAGDLRARGEAVTTRVLDSRFAGADRRVARALGVTLGARVLVLERLRLVAGRPLSLQRSYLPAAVGEEVVRADLGLTPLRQILEFKLGIVIARARETVSAIRLARREARELGCRTGAPAFGSERVSLDVAGQPVVFDHVFIPGDRFRITRELHYDRSEKEHA